MSNLNPNPKPSPSRRYGTTASLILLIILIFVANCVSPGRVGFLGTVVLLIAFLLVLSNEIAKMPFGFLVNERNLMSLARFQTVMWTVILLSGFVSLALIRIRAGVPDPLNITVDPRLWALMGISVTSLVGAPLLNSAKKDKTADPNEVTKTADSMVRSGNVADSLSQASAPSTASTETAINQYSQGVLYANPRMTDASFTDIFEGDEVGNAAHIDLAKVQMFFFTVILGLTYLAMLANLFKSLAGKASYQAAVNASSLPAISEGMVALLGISHAGFLASGGITKTKTP